LAGVHIAISQPIRVDDVVIIEGEWGRIEEISLTYVVVRIWDLRRLVVPISHFIEKPFQNWTRVSAELLGAVNLYLDYSVPVEAIREELKRICESSPHWDGKVCGVQVTDLSERTMTVRPLVSAKESGALWELRCEVREKLVNFVKERYPSGLPRLRAEARVSEPSGAK
jgi:small-conductance mechanosensitive channel